MEITFLGTGCMMPTKDRGLFSAFITHENEGILVDCGEGTQRQMRIANINLTKITRILITHWHGDHVLGLPGLIQSLGASNYNKKLLIIGPKGTKKFFENMKSAFYFDIRIELEIKEAKEGEAFENKQIIITAKSLEHNVPCVGYRIEEMEKRKIDMKKARKMGIPEGPLIGQLQDGNSITFKGKKISPDKVSEKIKGKSIAIVMDTVQCSNAIALAKDADVLISESTFTSELEQKGEEYGHMTAKQAATIASMANAKMLVLAHFSQRYKTLDEINDDAKKVFENTRCAYDFMKIKI